MRKTLLTASAALMLFSSVGAPMAQAAQVTVDPPVQPAVIVEQQPAIQLYDCYGTTGNMGCGPGWFWRDGWHGWGCYPC